MGAVVGSMVSVKALASCISTREPEKQLPIYGVAALGFQNIAYITYDPG